MSQIADRKSLSIRVTMPVLKNPKLQKQGTISQSPDDSESRFGNDKIRTPGQKNSFAYGLDFTS